MARKSKFSIVLEAVDQVSPVAKKAGKSVDQEFLAKANEIARESTGMFGKLGSALGPVGAGLVGIGAAAVGIYKVAEAGAQLGKEVEKLGVNSGLTAKEINRITQESKAWESATDRLTGALALSLNPITGFFATVKSGFAEIAVDFARGVDAWRYVTGEAQAEAKAFKKLVEETANVTKFTPRFTRTRDPGVSFSEADAADIEKQAEVFARRAKEARDKAVERMAFEGQASMAESDQMFAAEQARLAAIASFAEQERELRRSAADRILQDQIEVNEIRFQEELDAYKKTKDAQEQFLIDIAANIGQAAVSSISSFVTSLASGSKSVAEASRDLFSGFLTQLGTMLIQLGTAAIVANLLSAIPFLAPLVGPPGAGVAAGAAAIAAGAAMVGAGSAIGSIGTPGGSSPMGSGTRRFDPDTGRRLPTPTGSGVSQNVTVNFRSLGRPTRSEANEIVDALTPGLADASRRGRLNFGVR